MTTAEQLDPSVLASYAVLRRPAAAIDQPPPINTLAEQVDFALGRYNPAYVRQLTRRPGGRRFFVVPGFPIHVQVPPRRCLPRELRARRPRLVEQQRERERQPIACVVTTSSASRRGFYGTTSCPRFRDVTKYENLATGVIGGVEQAGILPDEIATVRVHFSHAPTVQVPAVENFYLYKVDPARRHRLLRQLFRIEQRFERSHARTRAQRRRLRRELVAAARRVLRELSPTNIELIAADGHLVKDVKRPRNAELGFFVGPGSSVTSSGSTSSSVPLPDALAPSFESYCAQNPGAC